MWLDENDYPVTPDRTVVPIHLTLYFQEWRAKFQERQVQNKLAEAKRDASRQTKDSAPGPKCTIQRYGTSVTPRDGRSRIFFGV